MPVNLEMMDGLEVEANQDVTPVPPPLQAQPEEVGKRLIGYSVIALFFVTQSSVEIPFYSLPFFWPPLFSSDGANGGLWILSDAKCANVFAYQKGKLG